MVNYPRNEMFKFEQIVLLFTLGFSNARKFHASNNPLYGTLLSHHALPTIVESPQSKMEYMDDG